MAVKGMQVGVLFSTLTIESLLMRGTFLFGNYLAVTVRSLDRHEASIAQSNLVRASTFQIYYWVSFMSYRFCCEKKRRF